MYWEKDAEDGAARKRRRPKGRFMDAAREDMGVVEVMEEDAEDRNNWRWKIRCGDPWREKPERKRQGYIASLMTSRCK